MTVFSELLRAYFEESASGGAREETFRIAGKSIAMRFAGDRRIDEFSKALRHLKAPAGAPDLTLFVWDGQRQPAHHFLRAYLFALTNWWYDYTGPRGQLLDIHRGDVAAFYDPLSGLLSVADLGERRGFLWKRDASEMPYFEICAPARVALHAWLRGQDAQMVHGAAVGTESGGVLLAGPGGSGKSTAALSCLGSGLKYLSDDYCIVRRDGSDYRVHSLYGAAKLVGDNDLARFPHLAGSIWNQRGPGDKAALFINEHTEMIAEFPLKAILVPSITGSRETAIEPCSRGHAIEALAPSTMAQMPASGAADLAFMSRMVRSLPCYRLLAGTEMREMPAVIEDLLASAMAAVSGV